MRFRILLALAVEVAPALVVASAAPAATRPKWFTNDNAGNYIDPP